MARRTLPGAARVEPSWQDVLAARTASHVGAPVELLGDFLADLGVAATGRPFELSRIDDFRARGREAAQRGVPVRAVVDLYLTASREAWPRLTSAVGVDEVADLRRVGAAVLAAVDDVVAAVCEGYEEARRTASFAEESLRREFVDDLLTGTSRRAQLLERAAAFGMRLEAAHVVLVVVGNRRFYDHRGMVRDVEAALLSRTGAAEADLLVATRLGSLVAVVPAELDDAARIVADQLACEDGLRWRLAVSRPRTGASGVRIGFQEARSAVKLADRLGLADPVVTGADLLVYEVLARDRELAVELIGTVLVPLQDARGGAEPLLDTLRAYFACGAVAVTAAKQLHLSVRAVTYRLDRVAKLTRRDPGDPEDRFVLDAALRAARALGWPETPLGPRSER